MPKRKRGAKKQSRIEFHGSDDELFGTKDVEVPDEKSRSYYYDEIDEYNLQREEKLLLKDEEPLPKAFDQEEVLAVRADSEDEEENDYHFDPDEDDGDSDMDDQSSHIEKQQKDMASDIEDDDDDLPDIRAWGKRKSTYYDTDYVDKGYRDYRENDAEAAEAEEKEILALEKRLTEEMQESDFGLEWLEESKPETQKTEEKVKVDLQSLNKKEKLEFLERTSPEFMDFRSEFVTKLTELQEKLQPLIDLIKDNKIPPGQWKEYILTKYQLILQYCTNISFYFALKAKGVQASDHPVIKRLLSYRKLLRVLDSFECQPSFIIHESAVKEKKLESLTLEDKTTQENFDVSESEVEEEHDTVVEESKRGITYEIAKNKGLTPYRKKELRNPRVKHRRKYERAKVRRKGQVREVVTETTKYGGEYSGIKRNVTKSTKLK